MRASWIAAALMLPLAAQGVQLKSGEFLVGEITDPGEDSLTLRRFDNGGTLVLRWDQLTPGCAQRLKQLFSLAQDEEGEVMVAADIVEYQLPAGGVERLVGKIVSENEKDIVVRSRGALFPIPRLAIVRRTSGEAPALQVLTKDEFYGEQLQAVQPGEDADRHILLAEILLRVRDYDRAEQHLHQAEKLGNSKQPAALAGKLQLVALLQNSQAERDALDAIATCRARGEFVRGLQLIDEWERKYGTGKLKEAFGREKARFQLAREKALVRAIADTWYGSVLKLAQKKANENGVTLRVARTYAESELGKELRTLIGKAQNLTPDEVDGLWKKRLSKEHAGVLRKDKYYYGIGSWVLGATDILKDTVQGKAEKQDKERGAGGEMDREMERIARRLAEARRRAAQAQQNQDTDQYTEEDWWREAKPIERAAWIRAYYAEKSGDLTVIAAYVTPCTTCGGEGSIPFIGDTGQPGKAKCHTCQGTRFKREIRAQ
jgi:hypothetical protein